MNRRDTTRLFVFAALSLTGNALGSILRYPDVGAAVLFPAYALLTAALLVVPRRDWTWYILVDASAHLIAHWPQWPLSWVLLAGVANMARAVTAAALLRRVTGGPPRLDSISALSIFIAIAVVIAPAVGATIGAADVRLHGAAPTYWAPWLAWFVSNALTGLTMLPAFATLFAEGARQRLLVERRYRVEASLLAAALGLTCAFTFVSGLGRQHLALPLYGTLPVLIWAALRFGPGGAGGALTAVAFAAIWSVDRGTGPFLAARPDDNVLALQIFVLLTAVPVLCLAAVASARQRVVRLHRALLASLQDHVAILDAGGLVLETNESWRRFADARGARPLHRVRPGDDFRLACETALRQGDAVASDLLAGVTNVLQRSRRRFEMEYDEAHDGRVEAYAISVEALERPDGGAVVIRADVTARRRAQSQIEEQRRELSHLARVAVLGQLSGAFAHELNQPLAAILSNAEAARRILKRDTPDVASLTEILTDIVADGDRATAVIYNLRGMLRRGERQVQLIDTRELIVGVLTLARTELIVRGVEANTVIDLSLQPVWGDKVQLQQVMLNLILNGCEAMSDTPAPRRRLVITADADGPESVHVSVRDSGTGIPPELIDRLFEPFLTTKPDGLGLGLSISRTIIATHGGRLWAVNNPDGGATMHLVVPSTAPSCRAPGTPIPPEGGNYELSRL